MKRLLFPRNFKDLLWIQRIKIILVLAFIAEAFVLFIESQKRIIPGALVLLFSAFRRKPTLSRFSVYAVALFSVADYIGA